MLACGVSSVDAFVQLEARGELRCTSHGLVAVRSKQLSVRTQEAVSQFRWFFGD